MQIIGLDLKGRNNFDLYRTKFTCYITIKVDWCDFHPIGESGYGIYGIRNNAMLV